jgi:hypothetical protein
MKISLSLLLFIIFESFMLGPFPWGLTYLTMILPYELMG